MEPLSYLTGFDNQHETEALPGALPVGQFSPQKVAFGLYAEQFTSTAFTAPRAHNRRTWMYRIRPSAQQGDYVPYTGATLVRTSPNPERAPMPNMLRWSPLPIPTTPQDFVDGLVTLTTNGNAEGQTGIGIHLYLINQSMHDRFFYNADGELLLVPQTGALRLHTECGIIDIAPGEIAVVPRGMKFRVVIKDTQARGYVCENYGAAFALPERGPVGANGFANDRDFQYPVAAFEDREGKFELVCKYGGHFFSAALDHSPLDVVAWTGNSAPYKYDLARFNVINTVSYDHPDPSIFTVISSPSDTPGVANCDFVIFPPRWMVADNTFRPPWYHRNIMSEFMGLIHGVYDAKEKGFEPGGASLHNCMSPHGPEAAVYEKASTGDLKPQRYDNTLAFMFESRYAMTPTKFAMTTDARQLNYVACWDGLKKHFSHTQ